MRQIGYRIKEHLFCAACATMVLFTVSREERTQIWEHDDTEEPLKCSRCNKALDGKRR